MQLDVLEQCIAPTSLSENKFEIFSRVPTAKTHLLHLAQMQTSPRDCPKNSPVTCQNKNIQFRLVENARKYILPSLNQSLRKVPSTSEKQSLLYKTPYHLFPLLTLFFFSYVCIKLVLQFPGYAQLDYFKVSDTLFSFHDRFPCLPFFVSRLSVVQHKHKVCVTQ